MARILIVGNPDSSLVRARGLIPKQGGHQVFWFSPQPAALQDVASFHLPEPARKSFVLRALLEPLYLSRALRAIQPDLVHVHYASRGISAIPLAGTKPLIVSVMGSDVLHSASYRFPYSPFTRSLLNASTLITSKSDFLDQALLRIGNYKSKIRRITWGVNLHIFRPDRDTQKMRADLGLQADRIVFFEPRSAKALYNKHVVVDAFKQYREQGGPKATLLLAAGNADNNYLSGLKKQIERSGLNADIRWLDKISAEEMADAYCLADVVISAPQSDGMPQSFYEALACGCFLLVGDLPQYAELVDNCSGIARAPVGDSDTMAKQMLWLAAHPDERKKLAATNWDYAQKHLNEDLQKNELLNLYSQLVH